MVFRFVFMYVLSFCWAVSAQDGWCNQSAKLWSNPRDFFIYKESKAYCNSVRENGFQWQNFKTFAKTPTGQLFLAYQVVSTVVQGYGLYKAYQYAKPDSAKSDDTQINV